MNPTATQELLYGDPVEWQPGRDNCAMFLEIVFA